MRMTNDVYDVLKQSNTRTSRGEYGGLLDEGSMLLVEVLRLLE